VAGFVGMAREELVVPKAVIETDARVEIEIFKTAGHQFHLRNDPLA
jgi:hypothetical protein